MPFAFSDGTCAFCREGLHTACVHGGFFDGYGTSAAQAEAVRVPYADGTLYALPVGEDDALMPSLLTLSDVLGTGHHAAVVAGVKPGDSVAVVGDGAVGLCGVIAAKRLGRRADHHHGPPRGPAPRSRASSAPPTSVAERGEAAVERILELTGGFGVARRAGVRRHRTGHGDVGGDRAARRRRRPRRRAALRRRCPLAQPMFFKNVKVGGGPAPVRAYIDELLPDILEGNIEPGRVFDRTVGLDGVPDGYRAMADRESIKVLVTP